MAKIGTTVKVPVSSHAKAREKLFHSLAAMGATLDTQNDHNVLLKRGSQAKFRLLGGLIVKEKDFPVLAEIQFNPATPTDVDVIVTEHMVVGIPLGVSDKYQRACTEFAKLIAEAMQGE